MAEFIEKQKNLQTSRANLERSRQALYSQQELFKLQQLKIKNRLKEERIPFLKDSDIDQKQLVKLQDEVYDLQLDFENAQQDTSEAEHSFQEHASHTQMVENLIDDFPILLMPVKVHTRFVNVKHLATNISQESVFDVSDLEGEDLPSLKFQEEELLKIPNYYDYKNVSEVNDLLSFLNDNSHFGYFKKNKIYKDRNWLKIIPDSFELWVRIYPDDIFVHTHETHLTPQERADGESFWETWWAIHENNSAALEEEQAADDLSEKNLFLAWSRLQSKYQASRAAWIFRECTPLNYRGFDKQKTTNYSKKPDFSQPNKKIKSEVWTQPILSWVMPDKFVVTLIQDGISKNFEGKPIQHPLKLSPVPSPDATLEEIKWAEDIDEAEQMGMAIKIPLKANGFKVTKTFQNLVVVGMKNSVDEKNGKILLEKLFENHRYKGKGMAILPQGTPTNNFEKVRSGYTAEGLPKEETFKLETGKPLFKSDGEDENEWDTIKDGEYLVNALGIDASTFQHIHKGDSKNLAHSFAMNKLLWPATMGYYLEQFFQPTISKNDIEKTRDFFINHVAAAGHLPVFRVNQQPYGILPITNFTNWGFQSDEDAFIKNLWEKVLNPLSETWGDLAKKVKNIADPDLQLNEGQFSEELVKILGLKAGSTTFFQRPQVGSHLLESAQAAQFKTRPINPSTFVSSEEYTKELIKRKTQLFYRDSLPYQLNDLNLKLSLPNNRYYYQNNERIFSQHFSEIFRKFPNPLVDEISSSENRKLSEFEHGNTKLNYLEWLKKSTYQDLKDEHFSKEKNDGQQGSLLYLLTRQAMARNYIDLATSFSGKDKLVSTIDFEMEHFTKHFVFRSENNQQGTIYKFGAEINHFLENVKGLNTSIPNLYTSYLYQNNKWGYLNKKMNADEEETIGDVIERQINSNSTDVKYLPMLEAKKALNILKDLSTAELERLLSGHLDLCSYRLDAWVLGLVNQRLNHLRSQNKSKEGIYLGAFGYVEDLTPNKSKNVFRIVENPEMVIPKNHFEPDELVLPMLHFQSFAKNGINVNELLQNAFIYLGRDESGGFERSDDNPEKIVNQAYEEATNQGFIHTPSQAHATTAAILRSGFMANNPGQATDEFAINLSSERVRKALYYIQGMRNGQELAALLGYQFERDLHDNPIPYLDAYLLDFRKRFPLQKEALAENNNDTVEIEKSFNVVNGLDLIKAYQSSEDINDFFKNKIALSLNQNEKQQFKKALEHLIENLDAISDLMVSESIFHTAKGDITRSGSVLKMLSNDKEIAIPEITKTPKKGYPLSHLVGVQFDLKSTEKIWAGVESPRSRLNPGLNRWLSEQLPNPKSMCFNVEVNGVIKKLSVRNLLLQPIDFIALFQEKNQLSETSALTFLVKEVAIKFYDPPLNAPLRVLYADKRGVTKTQFILGELKPLIENLLQIIKNSRPMFPTDLQLSSKTRPLEKEFYDNLDHSDFLEAFKEIVEEKENGFLFRNYVNINSFTIYYKKSIKEKFPNKNEQTTYTKLLKLLHDPVYYTQLKEDYNLPFEYKKENENLIVEKGERAVEHYEKIYKDANILWNSVKNIEDKKQQWEGLVALGKLIFGNSLVLFPKFRLNNSDEFEAAKKFPDLMNDVNEGAALEWLQGLALVRERIQDYKRLETYRSLFNLESREKKLEILQLPYQANSENYRWLGSNFSSQIKIKGEQLSIAMEYPPSFDTLDVHSGMIIDSWTERIQSETTETAFALHYNQPNTEAPQSCLLCVTPKITGNWNWEDLVGCVLSAMDLAKKRAVEPKHFDEEDHNQPAEAKYMKGHPLKFILPALSIPVSNTTNTPAVAFDENNNHF